MTVILVLLGGGLFGSVCFILGSVLGHDAGASQVARLRADVDAEQGDGPDRGEW